MKYFLKVAGISSGYDVCPRLTAGGSIRWSLITIRADSLQWLIYRRASSRLEGEQEVDLAVRDERRVDLLAEPEVGRHVAPSLGHAVDLALFHVITRFHKHMGEDVAREDRTLAADAGE